MYENLGKIVKRMLDEANLNYHPQEPFQLEEESDKSLKWILTGKQTQFPIQTIDLYLVLEC